VKSNVPNYGWKAVHGLLPYIHTHGFTIKILSVLLKRIKKT